MIKWIKRLFGHRPSLIEQMEEVLKEDKWTYEPSIPVVKTAVIDPVQPVKTV